MARVSFDTLKIPQKEFRSFDSTKDFSFFVSHDSGNEKMGGAWVLRGCEGWPTFPIVIHIGLLWTLSFIVKWITQVTR